MTSEDQSPMYEESATNRVDNAEKFTGVFANLTRHERAEIARLLIEVRMRVKEREKAEEEKE